MVNEDLGEVLNNIQKNDILELKNKGNEFYKAGKYEDALNFYNQALEINPNNTDVLNNKGLALVKVGQIEEAKKTHDILKEIQRKNSINTVEKKSPQTKIPDQPLTSGIKKYCHNCGNEIKFKDAEICPNCGIRIQNPRPPSAPTYKPNILLFIWPFSFIIFIFGGFVGGIIFAVLSAIFVYIDAEKIKAGKNPNLKGTISTKPWEWAGITALLWIIGYPWYLYKRREIFIENNS